MRDDEKAAERLLDKLRSFSEGLDPDERLVLAALIGPGIALAYPDDEVEGFAQRWEPSHLPEHLAAMIRARNLRIEGF
jgi:hypothetical protein